MTWKLGHDKFVSFLTAILVATSFFFFSYDSFYSIQVPFSGRDLESVWRLSGGPSYLVLVAVAQNLVTTCLNC